MADDKSKIDSGSSEFSLFVSAVRECINSALGDVLKAAGKDDDAPAIESTAGVIKDQFTKALDEISNLYGMANSAARADAEDFLRVQSGAALTSSIALTTRKITQAKIGGGFLSWLAKNLTEIKKLIGMLLDLLWPKAKRWWDKISLFLDQLINLLLSLLGGVLGMNRMALAAEMSQGEVNHLNEMAALKRLELASSASLTEDRD